MVVRPAIVDTSVLVGGDFHLGDGFDQEWAISVVTIGELEAGVLLAEDPTLRAARLRRLTAILGAAPVVPVERPVAARYGELRSATGRRPTNDLWIAATALAHDLTLVTADRHQAALPLVRSRVLR